MKQITGLLFFMCVLLTAKSQTTPETPACEVAVEALKGTYEGECSKGKANGEGKAKGTDSYEGTFKNGYPDGMGKYTWKNGDYYTGKFKKGLKEGKGELHTTVEGQVNVQTGYWKKDEFKSEYENPYVVYSKTSEVGRVEVNKMKSKKLTITVTVESVASGNDFNSSIAKMTDVSVVRGSFVSRNVNALSNSEITTFQQVIFPFRATFMFGNNQVDIEFFEEGEWDVRIPINK